MPDRRHRVYVKTFFLACLTRDQNRIFTETWHIKTELNVGDYMHIVFSTQRLACGQERAKRAQSDFLNKKKTKFCFGDDENGLR